MNSDLTTKGFQISLQWTPAHCGINGNEKADTAAKRASKSPNIYNLSMFLSEYNANMKQKFKIYLNNEWNRERVDTFLGKHKLHWENWPWVNNKNRSIEVGMARLRLGVCRLNEYMYRFKLTNSPNCRYCNIPETIEHFILYCHRHYTARCILKRYVGALIGTRNINVNTLLGGSNTDLESKQKIAQALIKFLIATKRIQDL